MSKRNKNYFDYRVAKKILNKFHHFSFSMPPRGRDFTGPQKAAITRIFNRYADDILKVANEQSSFVPGKRIPGTVSTNKGSFVPYPKAKRKTLSKKSKLKKLYKKWNVEIIFTELGLRREGYLPFPKKIISNLDVIKIMVQEFVDLLKPDYVRWAVKNQRYSEVYDPDSYTLYGAEWVSEELGQDEEVQEVIQNQYANPHFIGVYLGWAPDWDKEAAVYVPARASTYMRY